MKVRAVNLGREKRLVAVVHEPAIAARGARPAVIIFNSGFDHRVGTSRIWFRLAHRLCAGGRLVVRFDHTGVGDSPSRRASSNRLETYVSEAREVMDDVEREYGVSRFILVGHCSGGVTAFKTARGDERVAGAVSINGHGLDASADWRSYVRTRRSWRYYWRTALRDPVRWRNALRGRIDFRQLASVASRFVSQQVFTPGEVSTVNRRLRGELSEVAGRGACLLFVFTDSDDGEEYFDVLVSDELRQLLASGRIRVETLSDCDHDVTLRAMQSELFDRVDSWLAEVAECSDLLTMPEARGSVK